MAPSNSSRLETRIGLTLSRLAINQRSSTEPPSTTHDHGDSGGVVRSIDLNSSSKCNSSSCLANHLTEPSVGGGAAYPARPIGRPSDVGAPKVFGMPSSSSSPYLASATQTVEPRQGGTSHA
ncbi:unnamed protein product [Protopolystoma xenopodis]|uniref:Uncharacterized protein n=1 Tax=Protopolystoma xenopodis TaxID=117903 RepID=A0A448WVJ5_9PLAT|nr:unnamed protein product [Protopolystoma xenopodis]